MRLLLLLVLLLLAAAPLRFAVGGGKREADSHPLVGRHGPACGVPSRVQHESYIPGWIPLT